MQFQENLALPEYDERRQYIFNIYGDAGVGKTYLTKQLQRIAQNGGISTAYIDESADDPLSVMNSIAEQFSRGGHQLSDFEKRVAAYRQRRHELESDPQAPDGVASFLTKTAVTVALAAARDVPFAGSLVAPIDASAVAEQANRAREYLAQKFSDRADVQLLLSPADELTPIFVSNLVKVVRDSQVALFFDTYERTSPLLDSWLRDLYVGNYGDLPAKLITTISGQHALDPNAWGEYLPVIAGIHLDPFTAVEARQFLASKDITDTSVVDLILNLSGRLPMWLATLAEAHPSDASDIDDPAGDAVSRFLKWENDPARRAIAISAALPRTFNEDILQVLVGEENTAGLSSWLMSLPFVSRSKSFWKYHEVARAAMIRLQRAQSPEQWKAKHQSLALAHKNWAKESVANTDVTWTSDKWVSHSCEAAYHSLCANPVSAIPMALSSAVYAARIGRKAARKYAVVFSDAARDSGEPVLKTWAESLQKGVDSVDLAKFLAPIIDNAKIESAALSVAYALQGRISFKAEKFEEAVVNFTNAIQSDSSKADVFVSRGLAYSILARDEEALEDFGHAIDLDSDNSTAYSSRAILHLYTGDFNAAIADSNRAIELSERNVIALANRGASRRALKLYSDALSDYDRAIEIDPESSWLRSGRSRTYFSMRRYEEALSDLDYIENVDPTNSSIWLSRGDINEESGRTDEALADYSSAVELDPSGADGIAGLVRRGYIFLTLRRYEEAIAEFDQIEAVDAENANAWLGRGKVYFAMHQYDDALRQYDRSLSLSTVKTETLCSRALTYYVMGDDSKAFSDYEHAIELDPQDPRIFTSRGEVYRLAKRFDDALADFSHAIGLGQDDIRSYLSRGQVFEDAQRYDDALADFNRAVEDEPNEAVAYLSRGRVHEKTNRYDEALSDFNRALDLANESAEAYSRRGTILIKTGHYDEGAADLQHAGELDQSSLNDLTGDFVEIAVELLKRGSFDECERLYSCLVEVNPSDGQIFNNLGFCLIPVNPKRALMELERAANLNPRKLVTVANRVLASHMLGRHERAISIGTSRGVAKMPDENAFMWRIDSNHELVIEENVDVSQYLTDLVLHIRSGCAYPWHRK